MISQSSLVVQFPQYCFFHTASFFRYKASFLTALNFLYKIRSVSKYATALSEMLSFAINLLNGCLIFPLYFICINRFLKICSMTAVPGVAGSWSDKGYYVLKTQENEGFTTYKCDHLTNFDLLMDVSQTRYLSRSLSIITWIGCGISITGLILTIIAFLYLRYIYFWLQVLKQCIFYFLIN